MGTKNISTIIERSAKSGLFQIDILSKIDFYAAHRRYNEWTPERRLRFEVLCSGIDDYLGNRRRPSMLAHEWIHMQSEDFMSFASLCDEFHINTTKVINELDALRRLFPIRIGMHRPRKTKQNRCRA